MQDEVLDRCRKAASSEEQTKALEAVVDYVRQEGVRISAKEWVARSVILEFPYSQNVDSIDRILDGCGTVTSLSIVAKILREFSSKGSSSTMTQLPFQSVLQASFKTIHRLLLSSKGLQTEDLKQDVQQFVKMILLFPQIIANACHKLQLHQPAWATPSKFFTQLVASAEAGENDHHYTSTLIKAMLRSLKSDFVAMGLANRHPFTKAAKLDLSPRETAMFVFSMLQHFVSSDPENDNVLETCLQILKASSPEHREAFVQFSVLSKHDSRICNWIVQLLESCDCLYSNLCDIAETWSQWSFVHQTEGQHQYAVTQVLLCGLSKLKTEETPGGDDLTLALLQGVTHRLESSFPPIRKDGMQIAQAVAKRLGEDLQFEELNQQLGNATQENANPGESLERNRSVMIENPKKEETIKRRRKPRVKRRQLDPDADYESSDDDEQDDGTTEDDGSDSFDDNSITWDDELAPYDLNDPEDDLVETRKPLHLIECLELLRTIESDDHAYSSHETALQSLPDLIQSRPDNLPDIAVSLVLQLLRMENKFNITNFLEMRQDAMTCLVIQEPILVGQHLIDEVFEDGALGDRLNIFAALQEAAYDLSESKSLDEHRAKRDQQKLENRSAKATSEGTLSHSESHRVPHHLARIQSKTRRKRSKSKPLSLVQNRFNTVAPIWFYSLLAKFMEHRENVTLWRGSTGSQLLANLFRTLATIVEFSGLHSSQILGKDLFDLVWAFRTADVAEVRLSVLVSIATSFAMLPGDRFIALFQHGDVGSLPRIMNSISRSDPDEGCRALALTISRSLDDVLGEQIFIPQK